MSTPDAVLAHSNQPLADSSYLLDALKKMMEIRVFEQSSWILAKLFLPGSLAPRICAPAKRRFRLRQSRLWAIGIRLSPLIAATAGP